MRNIFILLIISVIYSLGYAQCSVVSTDGYVVTVKPRATSLTVVNNGGGCTYVVNLDYEITFTGTNIPSSLYTLQGDIRCNGGRIFFDLPNNGGTGSVVSSNASFNGNCSGLTVANLCDEVRIQIHGPGIPNQHITCPMVPSPSPLPIDLISFEGKEKEHSISLAWTTASERENDYFTLERSSDAENFETIGTILGSGTSTTPIEYSIEDFQATAGVNYYRLSQTDYNGTKETFDVIAVMNNKQSEVSSNIFPNPTQDGKITLRVQAEKNAKLSYSLYLMDGRFIETKTFSDKTIELVLPSEKTSYLIQVMANDEIIGRHRVVQH